MWDFCKFLVLEALCYHKWYYTTNKLYFFTPIYQTEAVTHYLYKLLVFLMNFMFVFVCFGYNIHEFMKQ